MGVLLTPIVIRHQTSLDDLRSRSIAVDGNLELYQFLSVMRTREGQPLMDAQGRITSHLNGLMFRSTRLIADYDIRPIFVFDGSPPELKREEIRKRRESRDKSQREYEAASKAGDTARAWSKAVMSSRLTRSMVDEAKVLLSLLGIPWIQAPSEGEAQAAYLAARGDVWAAGSKDYDSLLFGAPRLVRFLAIASSEFLPTLGRSRSVPPEILDLAENLANLRLTREQLIDVAILIGTDFNDGVRGIGPKTAVKRIREWGGLDQAPSHVRAALPETLGAIQSFLLNPPVSNESVPHPASPDEDGVYTFLCDKRGFAHERVRRAIERLRPSVGRQTTLDI